MAEKTFTIGGTNILVQPGWSIQDKINARSTMQMTVVSTGTLTADITTGQAVEITESLTSIFTGIILEVERFEAMPNILQYNISSVDNNAKADKRRIAASYTANFSGNIVSAILTSVLSDEGVTLGTIEDGPQINKCIFNYDSAAEALDKLKDTVGGGYFWNISFSGALSWQNRASNAAPWQLTDSVQHNKFRVRETLSQYRNRQYVRGGTGKTSSQVDEKPSPAPDGTSKKFIMRYPIAEKPTIKINSTAIATADVGVNGFDTGKKYYFSYASNVITQDDSETVLSAADTVEVTYIGLYPIIVLADSAAQIAARAAIETGTTGIYENMIRDKALDNKDSALDLAEGLIAKYGVVPNVITFETEVAGLKAGQLLTIIKSLYDINASYLIESVKISSPDGYKTNYSVKCLDGAALGGWEEFFKGLLRGQKEYIIEDNEVLVILSSLAESVSWSGATAISNYTSLLPALALYPAADLYPGTTIAAVSVNESGVVT
ncbi:MAG: hypothetical protein WC477_05990 [Patescibacteria group bacterium]